MSLKTLVMCSLYFREFLVVLLLPINTMVVFIADQLWHDHDFHWILTWEENFGSCTVQRSCWNTIAMSRFPSALFVFICQATNSVRLAVAETGVYLACVAYRRVPYSRPYYVICSNSELMYTYNVRVDKFL